uniref:Uncharacterized protein n=1 Tax=Brassica oleracea TaxID=3712 RepID=A0A3P6FNK3_BRAOL|nr:unnamed protein product [Brassica oleracea]
MGWHISRSQPKVCMIMLFTFMEIRQSENHYWIGWRENKARSDACWQSIKTSIHGVRVKRFEICITTYKATSPTINCHRNNIAIRCETCYYFKQMKTIVFH